jgi:drug/metabolite transporter (DMT)-like permease
MDVDLRVMAALAFSCAAALCFGSALVTARAGLRVLDAATGATISIPSATVCFVLMAPAYASTDRFVLRAAALFAAIGLFFPALVMWLTFQANARLGPTTTSALSSTAPLFALGTAGVLLHEPISLRTLVATFGVLCGVVLLSYGELLRCGTGWAVGIPLVAALLRGLAQTTVKLGLASWPSPFTAALIGYLVSSAAMLAFRPAISQIWRRAPRIARVSFVLAGVLNGAGVLLMYVALSTAPVRLVAPVIATYPLFTALIAAAAFRELPSRQVALGTLLTVASVVYLVAS